MKSTIFTAISYPNGRPHIGHAFEYVLADVFARYSRDILKNETFFCTGTDEHGQKVYEKALSENLAPQDFVNKQAEIFKSLHQLLQISYDRFIQTTDADHKKMSQELWMKMYEAGDIYMKEYEGKYCVGCESYKKDSDLNEKGECPDHLKAPEILKEKNWFFRLSKYADFLKQKIESDEIKIIPTYRKNEIFEFMKDGLQDISFSRSKEFLTWGVDVPNDDSQVMYVWCDALTNYLTAAQNQSAKYGGTFWEDKSTVKMLNVIGKDISRFHVLFWPAMLKSAGLPLPQDVLVHGMILSNGQKMSKSLGNVVNPVEVVAKYNELLATKSLLSEKIGSEFFRYFFTKNISSTEDGDFTRERAKELYNADLANGLGNLVSRVLRLTNKYLEIKPQASEIDVQVQHPKYFIAMQEYDLMSAMGYIWSLIKEADEYMQSNEPFKVVKVDLEKGKKMLEELQNKIFQIVFLLKPFMPTTSVVISDILEKNEMPERPIFPRYE